MVEEIKVLEREEKRLSEAGKDASRVGGVEAPDAAHHLVHACPQFGDRLSHQTQECWPQGTSPFFLFFIIISTVIIVSFLSCFPSEFGSLQQQVSISLKGTPAAHFLPHKRCFPSFHC